MLRINYVQTDTEQRWTLAATWQGRGWPSCVSAGSRRGRCTGTLRAVVDLSDVTFIDESGESLLSEMQKQRSGVRRRGRRDQTSAGKPEGKGERPLRRFIASAGLPLRESRELREPIEEKQNEKSV